MSNTNSAATDAPVVSQSQNIRGICVLLGVISTPPALWHESFLLFAGLCYWLASGLSWQSMTPRNRLQALVLSGIGIGTALLAVFFGNSVDLSGLLKGNIALISMLVAVSFLGLVSQPRLAEGEQLPTGKRSILGTLLGVHFFGAVINLSALFILGDRLSQHRSLSRAQVVALTRAFSAAAFWSPFFAAMGVALTYAPQAKLSELMLSGACLAVAALVVIFFAVRQLSENERFEGYPLRLNSLWLPTLLAVAVLVVHYLYPQLSILFIITLSAPLICILTLLKRGRVMQQLRSHVHGRLANMTNEVVLFLSAGVFSFGLQSLLVGQESLLPFTEFNALTASLSYAFIMVLAVSGLHPVIGISIIGPLLMPLQPDQSMLGIIFLSSWALGSAAGPLSGMNISIQGKYGIDGMQIMRWNLPYMLGMSGLVVLTLFVFERF